MNRAVKHCALGCLLAVAVVGGGMAVAADDSVTSALDGPKVLGRVPTSDEYDEATRKIVDCLLFEGLTVLGPVKDDAGRWVYASGDQSGKLDEDRIRTQCVTVDLESIVLTYQLSLPPSSEHKPVELPLPSK